MFRTYGWQAGHQPLRLSFGASSTLARQIEQGAPANLFASADEKWMDYLAEKKLIAADTRKDLLGNDLVLVVPADKPHARDDRREFRSDGPSGAERASRDRRSGACAGRNLRRAGAQEAGHVGQLSRHVWRATDDVRAALLLVERGEAPAGIVYAPMRRFRKP